MLGPVDRGAEHAEKVFEGLLVLGDKDVAQLDEVRAGDRDRPGVLVSLGLEGGSDELGVIGERGVAADAEKVLHTTLRRESVVVPADRVEDGLACHALVAGDDVGLSVRKDVSDVQ